MKKLPILLLLLSVFSFQVYTQTYLNIKKTDGSKEFSPVSAIRKLTFSANGDVLQIALTSGGIANDSLKSIRKVTFDNTGDGNVLAIPQSLRQTPAKYELSQNYPNPFNPSTIIRFSVPEKQHVSLKVYDVLGNVVTTLVNEEKPSGQYSAMFDARNIASGVYFYKLTVGSVSLSKKMLVIK